MVNNRYLAIAVFTVLVAASVIAFNGPSSKTAVSPCNEPLTYRIASIDSRFDTDRQSIEKVMQGVQDLWETALDKKVLQYRPNDGTVGIHLIYGDEQQRTEDERQLSQRIERMQRQISSRKKNLKRLKSTYQKRKQVFLKSRNTYNEAVSSFNKKIDAWNKRGGVPPEKKEEVEQIQRKINRLKTAAKRNQANAESMRKRVNYKSEQINRLIKRQNDVINQYNKRFNNSHKFNQGRFIAKKNEQRINIYQYRNRAELKIVLAHEAGHAMGLLHVENPKSIMHEMMGEQNIFNLALTKEDKDALRKKCSQ